LCKVYEYIVVLILNTVADVTEIESVFRTGNNLFLFYKSQKV